MTELAMPADLNAALIEEAMKKSGLIWISLPGLPQPRAAWHVWKDGSAYVVTGGAEQPLPGLPEADLVVVTVRSKDKGTRLISWIAEVSQVEPGSEEWETIVPVLAKERLNAVDGEEQPARWAREAWLIRLKPTGEVEESPGAMPDGDHAVRPVPTPATSGWRRPFMIGGRHRRADR